MIDMQQQTQEVQSKINIKKMFTGAYHGQTTENKNQDKSWKKPRWKKSHL